MRLTPTPALLPNELLAIGAARAGAKGWSKTKLGRALESAWCKLSAQGLDASQRLPPNGQHQPRTAPPESWPGSGLDSFDVTAALGLEACSDGPTSVDLLGNTSDASTETAAQDHRAPLTPAPSLSFGDHLGIDYGRFHRTIATIETAIERRVAIACRYRRIRGGQESERVIEPSALHVDPALDSLYLIAYCRLRKAVRVFAVHRFLSARTMESVAPRRPELRTKAALQGAFRVWRDETVSQVHLRFFGDITTHVAERVVHKSQRIAWNVPPSVTPVDPTTQAATRTAHVPLPLPCAAHVPSLLVADPAATSPPTLDIHFEVAGTQEVLHWLLGYGAAVQVLAPLSLLQAHQRELSGGLARYPGYPQPSPQPAAASPIQLTTGSPPTEPPQKNKNTAKPRTSDVRG